MGPIVINIDPVIVQISHFSLRWYGLAIAAAMVAGFAVGLREAGRKGLDKDQIYSAGMWAVIGGLVGARILHVIDKWQYYLSNPAAALAVQDGGLAILGGIIGGAAACLIYLRRHDLPVGKVADAVAPALILGQAIGRIGCTINGDAVGSATNLPWGFIYTHPGAMAPSLGQAYQPTMVYEMAWDIIVFGILWWARDRIKVEGTLFLAYLGLYSAGKFVISFWREESIFLFGLQEAQVVALVAIAFAAALAINLASRRSAKQLPSVG
ncbi:MAG: prolipoprotein diacylglyceryl transferase [Chloroflexi bacterium]|nr:prolipoprotein diacylglyceryl transferase [Chloroflexota bacterium]